MTIKSKYIAIYTIICFVFFSFCTSDKNISGTIEIGNPEKVTGTITTDLGEPAASVPLRLLPNDYNVIRQLSVNQLKKKVKTKSTINDTGYFDTTKHDGSFTFHVKNNETYTLVGASEQYRYTIMEDSILVDDDNVYLEPIAMSQPDTIAIVINESDFKDGFIIVPGTEIAINVEGAGPQKVVIPKNAKNLLYVDTEGKSISKPKSIPIPPQPLGDTLGLINQEYTFSLKMQQPVSPMHYRFDWGDGRFSKWKSSTFDTNSWPQSGVYSIRVQIRNAQDTTIISPLSEPLTITLFSQHTISTPATPTVNDSVEYGVAATFTTGGSVSNLHHEIEYRFAWALPPLYTWEDPDSLTPWQQEPSATFSWSLYGWKKVRAQARSKNDTLATSEWSPYIHFEITK